MANVRFFRLNNLPDYSPAYKGIFVYVPTWRTLNAGETVDMGWEVVYPVPSNLQGNIPGTSIPYTSVWGSTYVPTWQNGSTWQEEVGGPTFARFYDENTGGFICTGDKIQRTGAAGEEIELGLWFGGEHRWELLTNYGTNDGISWDDLYDWFNGTNETGTNSEGYVVAGEAEIFEAEEFDNDEDGRGTEYTIYDPVLDMENGLHASTDASDSHSFTVGDGALKIEGKDVDLDTTDQAHPVFVDVDEFEIHSANDTINNTLTFDPSLYVIDGSNDSDLTSIARIGVRTRTQVTPENYIVTEADVEGMLGAMYLIGAVAQQSQLPAAVADATTDPVTQWQNGDTWIIVSPFTANASEQDPDNQLPQNWQSFNGHLFETGDTLVWLNGTWRHIQGDLTVGVKPDFVPQVSHTTGDLTLGLGLDTNNNEKHKLIATDGTGVYKTDIPVDFLDDLVVGLPEIDVQETAEGQDTAAANVGQDLCHEIELTHTYQIGAGSSDVYTHSLIINTPNKSIDIQVEDGVSDQPDTVVVDLVWRETLD